MTIAIGVLIAVLAGFVMGPRRTPADDAFDYVQRNGEVTGIGATSRFSFFGMSVGERLVVTEVSFPIERLSDEMVSHLVKLDSLQSIVLVGERPDKVKAPGKVSLGEIKSKLSDKSLAELQRGLPMVQFELIPASESRRSP